MALGDSRAALIRDKKPAFTTVLDVDAPVDASFTMEQLNACRYRGNLYLDFDGDLAEVIERGHEFADKLREQGVDLNSVHWYLTGGRGIHVEIPQTCFIEKPPVKGFQHLPAIYKEIIFDIYVDTVDLRVYSARRGRMWRVAGVQRDNGFYKVPVTAAEFLSLTVESYATLCAAPRHVEVSPPVFAHGLAVLFAKACQKIDSATKNKKSGEADKKLLLKFGGKFPPSLEKIMQGAPTNADTGFHNIALQIAVTANALGKTEAETVAACEGLFQNHVSTGYRYGTPAKRKAEVERLLRYTEGNPGYLFAKNAIKSICEKGADTSDLDGATESAGAELAAGTEDDHGLLGSVSMRESGIFCTDQEGQIKAISNLSFDDVRVMKLLPEGDSPSEVWGFDAIVKVKGKSIGRKLIENDVFSTKAKLNNFAMKLAAVMSGTDNQTTAITQLLHAQAEKNMQVQYVLRREGVDLVRNPDTDVYDLVYTGGGKVSWARTDTPAPYAFRSLDGPEGLFRSQLIHEPLLSGSEQEENVIRAMLKMNDPAQLLKLIGWTTSCFHRRIYHHISDQFPLCHVYGQAGSGKTQTVLLLNQIHYGSNHGISVEAADSTTVFAIERKVVASASTPVIIDEYKPRELKPQTLQGLRSMFRSVYNSNTSSRGGGNDSGGTKDYRVLSQSVLSGPVLFIAEAVESQPAIMERSVIVNMSKVGIYGRKTYFDTVHENRDVLARLGKTLLTATLTLSVADGATEFRDDRLKPALAEARQILGDQAQERPVFNLAVTLAGFDFFKEVLQGMFEHRLDADMAVVRDAIFIDDEETEATAVNIMADASKVIDTLAFISRSEEGFSQMKLEAGKDYCFSKQGSDPCIDLKMQECFIKYTSWSKAKNQIALYDNYEQFYSGLANYKPRVNLLCQDSKLTDPALRQKIYRFSLAALADERVGQFRDK